MGNTVQCVKLGKEAEAMDRAPIKGALGQRLFENVSKEGWQLWIEHSTILINELRLDFTDKKAKDLWLTECEKFFFGEGSALPEQFVPPTQTGQEQSPAAPSPPDGGDGSPGSGEDQG